MDGLVNPARGWISNANQDPTGQTFDNDPLNELRPGGGILYLSPGHSDGNRNARITSRIGDALADGSVSFAEMQSIQADVKLNDADGARAVDRRRAAARRRRPARRRRSRRSGPIRRCRRRSPGSRRGTSRRRPASPRATTPRTSTASARPPSASGDRRERRGDDLQPVARAARSRRSSTARSQRPRPRRLHAGRRPGDDGAAAAARLERDRRLRLPVLRRPGRPHAARARRREERARPRREPGVRSCVRRLDDSRRLPLGAAAPDHVLAPARAGVLAAAGRRASRTSVPAFRVSRPTAASASSTPRRTTRARRPLNGFRFGERARAALRRRDAAVASERRAGDPGGASGNPFGPCFGNQLGLWLTTTTTAQPCRWGRSRAARFRVRSSGRSADGS